MTIRARSYNDTHTFIMMMTTGNKTVAVFAFADSNLMILVAVADVVGESVGRALHDWSSVVAELVAGGDVE